MSVKHSLLALLGREADSASGLRASFAEFTEGAWPLDARQVAQTLSCLEGGGLIEVTGNAPPDAGGDAPRYRPTAAGRAETDRWFRDAAVRPAEERDELILKISLAAGGVSDLTSLLDAHATPPSSSCARSPAPPGISPPPPPPAGCRPSDASSTWRRRSASWTGSRPSSERRTPHEHPAATAT